VQSPGVGQEEGAGKEEAVEVLGKRPHLGSRIATDSGCDDGGNNVGAGRDVLANAKNIAGGGLGLPIGFLGDSGVGTGEKDMRGPLAMAARWVARRGMLNLFACQTDPAITFTNLLCMAQQTTPAPRWILSIRRAATARVYQHNTPSSRHMCRAQAYVLTARARHGRRVVASWRAGNSGQSLEPRYYNHC